MNIQELNNLLSTLAEQKRENIIGFSFALLEWMGITPNTDVPGHIGEIRPRLTTPQTQKLKDFLAPAPLTVQPQLYRLSAEGQNIKVRFAVLKKIKKETISQLIDNDLGLTSYQASIRGIVNVPGRPPYIPQQPYFIHFVTTPAYDKLVLIFNQGDQKRLVTFRNRLTKTQFHKILEKWQGIGTKTKPEIADILWKSLDIKEVNKEFYKQIKERFDTLVGFAKTKNTGSTEEAIKQFSVRLIGRYIFCWFLKEKGVIPEKLLSSSTISATNGFDKNVLAPLFFKTLNTPATEREILPFVRQLMNGQDTIPYLNGGLFDWHPEDVLFEKLGLDAWLETFVKVLEEFDFTVDESSSQYQMVAIDPEMLGRIFENLLASQNPDTEKMANQRKAFGAFYTPREIVDYMVNESLRAHLETQLMPAPDEDLSSLNEPMVEYRGTLFEHLEPQQTLMSFQDKKTSADNDHRREKIKANLGKLFSPDCSDNPFDKEDTLLVRKALSEITVLDPACGSGAFPMGMMLRLMELRQIVGHGHRNSYDLKEEILSRNIFGVDIMPMAVEIARLRAWLSLVLEADYKPADRKNNFGIAALPNLDFKFICANSLIDSGYDAFLEKIQYNATLYRLDGEIQKLENIRNQYFDPRGDKARKTELQQEFLATKQHIKEQISVGTLIKNYNLGDFFEKVDDWNPFDDSHPSSFFSPAWMFGIRNGFDVVIGNPPYGGKLSKEDVEIFKNSYEIKTSETAILFIEKGKKILNKFGVQSYIIPKSLTYASNYNTTRDFIEKGLSFLVDCGKAFEEVKLEACIFQLKNGIRLPSYNSFKFNQNSTFEKLSVIDKHLIKEFGFFPNGLLENEISLGKKISKIGMFIKDFASNSRGCLLQDNLKTQGEIKVIGGKEINKYGIRGVKGYINEVDLFSNKCRITKQSLLAQNIVAHITTPTDHIKIICCIPKEINDFAITDTINQLTINDEKYSVYFIWSLLSSTLINWYVYLFIFGKAIRTMHFDNVVTDRIPIPNLLQCNQQPFISKVTQILSLKKQNLDTTALEKEIDVLVYKLYELTYDEVKIVDKDFWLSEEEYNKTKLE